MELIITSKSDLRDLIEASVRDAIISSTEVQEKGGDRPKPWMTNREAQVFYGLSKSTLQRYRNSGRLPYSKIGGRVYYRRSDILRYLEESLQPIVTPTQRIIPEEKNRNDDSRMKR